MDYSNSTLSLSPEEAKGSTALKAIFLANFCVNFFGALLHVGLILVTVKNKRFHATCNLLIASNALATILAYLLVICPLWLLWIAPEVHMRLLPCFLLQMVPVFATFHVYSLMLAIGFDRLLSAFWALWYISRNDRFYLLLLLALSASFPLLITTLALGNVLSKPDAEKLCTLGDILGRQSSSIALCCLGCIFLSVCCYLLVWLRLKQDIRKGQLETVRSRQPIFRSLCIILCLQVGGWVLGQLAYALVYMNEQRMSPLARWEVNSCVYCFLSLAAALDVPVLYATSSEYKLAFHRLFPFLSKLLADPRETKKKPSAIQNNQKLTNKERTSRSPSPFPLTCTAVKPRF